MDLKEIIIELSAIPGPSGFENDVRRRIAEMLMPFVDEQKTDAMGNLIAVKRCGKSGAKTVMLEAHMDEIGFIVTGHEKGFLRFSSIGGVDPRMLPAREVRVLTEKPIYGVIDTLPPHVLDSDSMDKTIESKKLFIDIGMTQEEAEKLVPLGTPIVYTGSTIELGSKSICGKALDDRACVAAIIKAMEGLKDAELDVDLVCLITSQEELGYRGAYPGAFAVNPDYAISLDVTHAQTPDAKKPDIVKFGKGAAISRGPNMHRGLTARIEAAAKNNDIPYQIEVAPGQSGTNAWAIQISREGVATALLSIPVKYMHTPLETMSIADGEAAVAILVETIKAMGDDFNA